MSKEKRKFARDLIGKMVVSKSGKTFGRVGDISFETRTGEIIGLILKDLTDYASTIELEKTKTGTVKVPFNAVIAVEDFVVVAEEDIV
ncbi:MAG: PRC-barrel domain-containing protein [Candidatus Nanoarchaeia archaeon]|nr:PRC-barrel domain-containing protein [Candidatus Nanoarchaeia archaeon]